MTDEEFVFRETSRERKRNGIGTYHKKRQGGKHVRLPSDNLSKKEIKQMNGEVKVYNFAVPMSWKDFRAAPNDIKKEYLDTILANFDGITAQYIAESFGVKRGNFAAYINKCGIKLGNGAKRCSAKKFDDSESGKAWRNWVGGASVKVKEKPVEVVEVVKEDSAKVDVCKMDVCVNDDAQKIIGLITGLVGTGAKVTIEFTL